jgi:hypothetical protein
MTISAILGDTAPISHDQAGEVRTFLMEDESGQHFAIYRKNSHTLLLLGNRFSPTLKRTWCIGKILQYLEASMPDYQDITMAELTVHSSPYQDWRIRKLPHIPVWAEEEISNVYDALQSKYRRQIRMHTGSS